LDHELLSRLVATVNTLDELKAKEGLGRQLRIKFGVDATGAELHLGHAVNLHVMRAFQDAGHLVQLLLGDFTTRIGDPSGRNNQRPVLARDDIQANADAFIDQAALVLDTDPQVLEIVRNSSWLDELNLDEFLGVAAHITVQRLMSRDTFRTRAKEGAEFRLHEFCYPLLQAYDSHAMKSDVAICGTDQLYNEMLGRDVQTWLGGAKQVVMTTKITMGLCGTVKQSKSVGNYVGLNDSARDKFGKVMTLSDGQIAQWLRVYTSVPLTEVDELEGTLARGEMNPRDAKVMLARRVVERYHGAEAGQREEAWFAKVFSRREAPEDMELLSVPSGANLITILQHALPDESNSARRRLIKQGGVRLNNEKQTDENSVPLWRPNDILKIGKRRWFKLQ